MEFCREYDRNGNLISDSYRDYTIRYEYDDKGNKIYFQDSGGRYGQWEYDANGNMIHTKDSDGYEVWYEYDANGNMIHEKYSNGSERWYEYDANGNMIHTKDKNGIKRKWKHGYDSKGNLLYTYEYEYHGGSSSVTRCHYYTYWDNGKIKKELDCDL